MMVSQSHFSSGSARTTVSISSSSSSSSSSFTTGSSFGPKSSGLRDLKGEADLLHQALWSSLVRDLQKLHPLLLLLDEVVLDNLLQTCAVRLDEAFHLRVVQSTDLVIIKLFIKLKRQRSVEEEDKARTLERRRRGRRSPSRTGRPAATAARSSASLTTSASILWSGSSSPRPWTDTPHHHQRLPHPKARPRSQTHPPRLCPPTRHHLHHLCHR